MIDPFFAESGSQHTGLPLVLLHGFCETHKLWDYFRHELGKEVRVLCPDLPGFGHSTSLPAGFSLLDVAARIKGGLDQLGVDRCILIGHSLGGYVALAMLERYPALFAAIGMFHSTAYADTPAKKRSRKNVIDFVEKHGVEVFATSFVPQLFHYSNRKALQAEISMVVAEASKTPQYSLIAYTQAMQQRPDRLSVLEHFEGPVLYIIGEKDTSISLEDSQQQLENLHNCEAYILEEAGHMGMFEQQEESYQIIRDFISKVQQ